MAKYTHVEVNIGFTSNIGNYESVRTNVLLGATLEPGESVEEAVATVYGTVEETLVEKAREVAEALGPAERRKTGINPA